MRIGDILPFVFIGGLMVTMGFIFIYNYSEDVNYRDESCQKALKINDKLGYGNQSVCNDIFLPMRQITLCEVENGKQTNCIRYEYGMRGGELVVGREVSNY